VSHRASPGRREDTRGGFTLGGWGPQYGDEVLGREMAKAMDKPGDMLLGRRTWQTSHRVGPPDRRQPVRHADERDHQVRRLQDPVGLENAIQLDDLRLSFAAWGGKAAAWRSP
jgi:hypothetical protein